MSANPGIYNGFVIYRGLTFKRVITYYNSDGVTPIDLTGCTAEFKIKPSENYGSNLIDLTTSPDIVLGGVAGTITVLISASATAVLPEGVYLYSLKLANGSIVDGLLIGEIVVSGGAV